MTRARDFWSLVDTSDECWNWTGYISPYGYGEVGQRKGHRPSQSQTKLAHRIAYELLIGPIPDGLHLDHLCRNTRCVNPAHLEPVTVKENVHRGLNGILGRYCSNGHRYEPGSYTIREGDGSRVCRECCRTWTAVKRDTKRLLGLSEARVSAHCAECDRAFGLRADGCIFTHTISGRRYSERCPGSGQPPRAELRTLGLDGAA